MHSLTAHTAQDITGTGRFQKLMTSGQVAGFLGCTTRHIFNLRKRGMPAYQIGKIVRFDIAQVMAWLDSGNQSPEHARERQPRDLASEQNDNAECAASDLGHEFPRKS